MRISLQSRRTLKNRELIYFVVIVVAFLVLTSLTLPV